MNEANYRRRLASRIAAKVAPSGECLEWTGRRDPEGYGLTWAAESVTGQPPNWRRVHRIVWALAHGPISDEVSCFTNATTRRARTSTICSPVPTQTI